jgi:hypothetical protein
LIEIKQLIVEYSTLILKILLFSKQLKQKSPSAKAKGLEIVSSPYWKALELLREILHLKI